MRPTPHDEFRYYRFGLRAGVTNLLANGLRLGIKKTVGKITQPINSHTRFPEYYWFDAAIRAHLQSLPEHRRVKVLDVGSPKMFGLCLAFETDAEVMLSDISALNVDEYRMMWRGLERHAKGNALFSLQDARALNFSDAEFDVVYSMSVIEHVEGDDGDVRAIREMQRVLKPGGLLVLSVPFGARYVEQDRIGFSGAGETHDHTAYFFQRIYDAEAIRKRILENVGSASDIGLITVSRRRQWLGRFFFSLGASVRGALGFVNPLLSIVINHSSRGIGDPLPANYGQLHSVRDEYGDLIVTAQKP